MTKFISFTGKPLTFETFLNFSSEILDSSERTGYKDYLHECMDYKDELPFFEIEKLYQKSHSYFTEFLNIFMESTDFILNNNSKDIEYYFNNTTDILLKLTQYFKQGFDYINACDEYNFFINLSNLSFMDIELSQTNIEIKQKIYEINSKYLSTEFNDQLYITFLNDFVEKSEYIYISKLAVKMQEIINQGYIALDDYNELNFSEKFFFNLYEYYSTVVTYNNSSKVNEKLLNCDFTIRNNLLLILSTISLISYQYSLQNDQSNAFEALKILIDSYVELISTINQNIN
ncbi:hypothetical protein [Staphylococcus gallinarum]|uniref:hypothetical protein n=1 Tax=Staphylococcus gallinarum TaxID=1293 RepID=UPI001E50AEBB|nr:hypothetical protein [Staphylococcus gallinarum]MCD8903814.1 hypothetical protein [Staphylococcus gallinarum]